MSSTQGRTLLLAPPSIASHEATLHDVYAAFDRATSDLTMLDRLSSGLVALPSATYDLVVVIADGTRRDEALQILTRRVYDAVANSMKAGAVLRAFDGSPLPEAEAILAGLVAKPDGTFEKSEEEAPVLLRFGAKNKNKDKNKDQETKKKTNGTAAIINKPQPVVSLLPGDDLDGGFDDDDDDIVDENTLLSAEDINMTIQPPAECIPKIGKRRRACKDCTCGLAAKLEAEDRARRAKADAGLETLRLELADDDLALDFTVKGKVGSCGSCSLGDAFRCADCPYMGLPAFKPGEEVTILNNVAQL